MGNKDIKDRLQKEGYQLIHQYDDPPSEEFPDHDHPGDQLMIVLEGSIAVAMNGENHLLAPGDELYVPAHMTHRAKVGPKGCKYIVGEK